MSVRAILVSVLVALPLAAQKVSPKFVYPEFAVGVTGIRATIEKGVVVTVKAVVDGTPAAKAKLQVGDVLVAANRDSLQVDDPRVVLGRAIGDAEVSGRLLLRLERKGRARNVTLKLDKLGRYAANWPKDCQKSQAIVDGNAKFLLGIQDASGGYRFANGKRAQLRNLQACLASLFLLSTGAEQHVINVARHARALAKLAEDRSNAGGHVNWQLGYQGILLGEYYLRTGDKAVLAGFEELCQWCVDNQAAGGWSHGAPVGPGYVQSGLMNHAGVPIVLALTLARECGVAVDEAAYQRALALMDRMIGHGCVPYGDHRSELWWSNTNGRNAMLACGLSLFDNDARYRQASRHLALLVSDSYFQPEFGHTGGGFNVMWRGMASAHVIDRHPENYRRQMGELQWYYDLCRLPGGGFSMPPTPPDNERYCGIGWGSGAVGLTYTAPRHTLRITGAPRTPWSVAAKKVDVRFGNDADLVFASTAHAEGFGDETHTPREIYRLLLKDRRRESTVPMCAKYLRHYSPLVRSWAGRRLNEINSAEAHAALAAASRHADARVRRAAFDGASRYDNWSRPFRSKLQPKVVSNHLLPAIERTLGDANAAWWEVDGALFALGGCEPADIRKLMPRIDHFAGHRDWYLREAAFWAIVGLHRDITGEEFGRLIEIYGNSRHVFARSSYDSGFKAILKRDKVAFDRAVTAGAVHALGKTTHEPNVVLGYGVGGVHEAAHRTMMILKHFDPSVYALMVEDFVAYLSRWEPYYQHSVWLISGSKWQLGILKVLEGLGGDGAPIVAALEQVLQRWPSFDRTRIGKAGKKLEQQIREAIAGWHRQNK